MRLFWKKRLFTEHLPGVEDPEGRAAEQPQTAVDESDDDADLDALVAAREARQRIHISETTTWRYTSGLW
jgi:hypothetical protein